MQLALSNTAKNPSHPSTTQKQKKKMAEQSSAQILRIQNLQE